MIEFTTLFKSTRYQQARKNPNRRSTTASVGGSKKNLPAARRSRTGTHSVSAVATCARRVGDGRYTACGVPKGFPAVLVAGVLFFMPLTACGSADTDPSEDNSGDDDVALTTDDGVDAAGGAGADGTDAAGGAPGEDTLDSAVSIAASIAADDFPGDDLGMPAEDQAPPRDSLIPVMVDWAAYRVMEIDPPQVVVEVSGALTDPCQSIWSEWKANEDGTAYEVNVWGVAPTADSDELECAEVSTPFTEDVFLDGPAEFGGFPPGEYTILVNGMITLDVSI